MQDDFRRKFTEEQDELPRLSNKKRQKRNDLITVNLSGTRYEVGRLSYKTNEYLNMVKSDFVGLEPTIVNMLLL